MIILGKTEAFGPQNEVFQVLWKIDVRNFLNFLHQIQQYKVFKLTLMIFRENLLVRILDQRGQNKVKMRFFKFYKN